MKNHSFHPDILRAYDIRGTYGKTLTPDDAFALGLAMGTTILRRGGQTCALGYDGRISSPVLMMTLSDGLRAVGIHVHHIGLGPTPQLYFSVEHLDVDAGIMVTGSHNPADDNGFKIILKDRPFYGEDIQSLAALAAAGAWAPFVKDTASAGAGPLLLSDTAKAYTQCLSDSLAWGERPLKVVWDCGNGAGGAILPALVEMIPGHHVVLNGEVDGTFPAHPPDPTKPAHLAQLIKVVREEKADLGLALDGDADRLVAVDETGRILFGDQLLTFFAQEVLSQTPGATIIGDVKCSDRFFKEVSSLGGQPLMSRTGHSYIKAKIKETGAALAGEMSGHYFFRDRYLGFDDGIYAGLRLCEMLSRGTLSLGERLDNMPVFFSTPEIKIRCGDDSKFSVICAVEDVLCKKGMTYEGLDGVRVTTPDGWWLIRASNTEPVVVVRVEGQDPLFVDNMLSKIRHILEVSSSSFAPIDLKPLQWKKDP